MQTVNNSTTAMPQIETEHVIVVVVYHEQCTGAMTHLGAECTRRDWAFVSVLVKGPQPLSTGNVASRSGPGSESSTPTHTHTGLVTLHPCPKMRTRHPTRPCRRNLMDESIDS